MNDETAKVKIDAMHQRLRVVELCNIGLSGVMDQLNDRIAVMEGHVRELREANEATVEPKIDPLPKRSTFTVGGEPKYIRILPHGDSGADLPVGTVADYLWIGIRRVTKHLDGRWKEDDGTIFSGDDGTLSIISIPEQTPIDTMSIEDCRNEAAVNAGWTKTTDGMPLWYIKSEFAKTGSGRQSHPIPNTPEEQRKLPEGWRLTGLYETASTGICETASQWKAIAEHVSGQTQSYRGPDRDLAEWRLRVACERAVKSQ